MLLVIKPFALGFDFPISIMSLASRESKVWKGRSKLYRKGEKLIRCSIVSAISVLALGDCAFCVNYADYSRVI